MARHLYHFTMVSKEERGTTKPNILTVDLDEADIDLFRTNLEALVSCKVVSVTRRISANYALPYPAGNGRTVRYAMWSDSTTSRVQIVKIRNVKATTAAATLAADLIAAGIKLPNSYLDACVAMNGYDFGLRGSF